MKLCLPDVTLCAVASVNVRATVLALRRCLERADFADCLLFTDALISETDGMRVVSIAKIRSATDYSNFLLHDLVEHIRTTHCLVVQWDGFILDASAWDPAYLDTDYVGAPWPQFTDGHDVGNGGFSLRSRRLLEACRDDRFQAHHPEDVAICRTNRELLEQSFGMRFAERSLAERFAFERLTPQEPTFGFHGVFNMVPNIGVERFWKLYRQLDDRSTALTDFRRIISQIGSGSGGWKRQIWFAADMARAWLHRAIA